MPLFGSKFSPKKTPLRRSGNTSTDKLDDLIGADKTIQLTLGEQKLLFENGEWITHSGKNSSVYKINKKLKKRNEDLEDEINLLKLKYEILLNMMTEMTAKIHSTEHKIEFQNIVKSQHSD
ncbi:beta catenin antagonist chibby [Rhynchophorus ferrugineus]|uniref:Uncharacterized protein n=1 Tax=Rhynchophorus ferrugineus TaxID=354439 RepID=A0A834M530_RHYFE|nr:hypothetical protein GWI33_019677 [Rhynchophorus ferrugineus]